MINSCKTCAYYVVDKSIVDPSSELPEGKCHLNTPQMIAVTYYSGTPPSSYDQYVESYLPNTKEDSFCQDWKHKFVPLGNEKPIIDDAILDKQVWLISVASWGDTLFVGDEKEAENFRAHKANYEQSCAKKKKLIDTFGSIMVATPDDGVRLIKTIW
jgi:hypothetical protein